MHGANPCPQAILRKGDKMRKRTVEGFKRIRSQEDMIRENINRMCATDDLAELDLMALHAKKRVEIIRNIKYRQLTEKEVEQWQ